MNNLHTNILLTIDAQKSPLQATLLNRKNDAQKEKREWAVSL
jgi:hypothetical protein